jgi:malonyl-CoA decarboxylase
MNQRLQDTEAERLAGGGPVRSLFRWFSTARTTDLAKAQPAARLPRLRATLHEALAGSGGEVSARQRMVSLAQQYRALDDDGRQDFLSLLATEFGPDESGVSRAIQSYLAQDSESGRRRAEQTLRLALSSPRIRIMRQFNLLPEGVKFLVDLRADVLRYRAELPELEALDDELHSLFASWFDVGFLELRRISWDSPAALLERLIQYEAVHEIRSWNDMRDRLDSDRRCYAFFHPRMPDEPLVFVEVALVKELAPNVHSLLDESKPSADPQGASTAVFYSISNTQAGLRGVSFGGFLIKRVVEQLRAELPRLKTFATLSPLPGFRRWLDARLTIRDETLFTAAERTRLAAASGASDPYEGLRGLLATPEWHEHPELRDALAPVLTRLAARYLVNEKEAGRPLDAVARFHLGNGARLERVNWMADVSSRGLRQSAGVMVNYLYKLDDIESNHEAFARDGQVIVSNGVLRLVKQQR